MWWIIALIVSVSSSFLVATRLQNVAKTFEIQSLDGIQTCEGETTLPLCQSCPYH